jgi:hypothetical protein
LSYGCEQDGKGSAREGKVKRVVDRGDDDRAAGPSGANTVEGEDSGSTELAEVLPDEAFALSAATSVRERSRDDDNEDYFHRSHAEFWRTIR